MKANRNYFLLCAIAFLQAFVFYVAFSFEFFLLERVLLALSLSGMSGCDIALLYNSVNKEHSERAFGRYYALSTLGFLLATSASTFIVPISIDLTALLTIIPYGISVIAAFFLMEAEGEKVERPNILRSIKTVLNNRLMLLFIIAVALLSEVSHSVTVFLNQLQYQRSGVDIRYFGLIMASIQLLTMLSAKSYAITKSIGQGKTVGLMAGGICISTLFLAFTDNPAASIMLIAMVGLFSAMILPISSDIQNKSVNTFDRATILSAYAMTIDLVTALMNPIIGKTADMSLQLSFMVCGALAAIALLLLWYFFRRTNKKAAAEL